MSIPRANKSDVRIILWEFNWFISFILVAWDKEPWINNGSNDFNKVYIWGIWAFFYIKIKHLLNDKLVNICFNRSIFWEKTDLLPGYNLGRQYLLMFLSLRLVSYRS